MKLLKTLLCTLLLSFQLNAQECNFYELEPIVMIDEAQSIEQIISSCPNLEQLVNVYQENLLFTAVRYSSWNALEAFERSGFSFLGLNFLSQNLLHLASDQHIADYLIARHVRLGQADRYGRTPLSMALEREDLELARFLLSHLNTASVRDLEWAADYYQKEALELLAQAIRPELVSGEGRFFRTFFFNDPDYRAIAHKLVQKGADLNQARSIRTQRPVLQVYVEEYVSGRHSDSEAIDFLLEHGANPNIYVTRRAQSLLAHLITKDDLVQNFSIIESMLQAGLNLRAIYSDRTILMEIAFMRADMTPYIRYFIEHDSHILNMQNSEGMTALHSAIRWQNMSLAHLLLELKVNTYLKNHDGLDALEYAEDRLRIAPDTRTRQALVNLIREIRRHRRLLKHSGRLVTSP